MRDTLARLLGFLIEGEREEVRVRHFYSDEDLRHIIQVAGGSPTLDQTTPRGRVVHRRLDRRLWNRRHWYRELESRLERCAAAFLAERRLQQQTAPSEIAKRLRAFTGRKWRSALTRYGHEKELMYALRRGALRAGEKDAKLAVSEAIASQDSGRLARQAEIERVAIRHRIQSLRKMREKEGKKPAPHRGDVALDAFIADLIGIWMNFFAQIPGTSLGSIGPQAGKARGPFLRFVVACYDPLRDHDGNLPNLTMDAVRDHFRRTNLSWLKSRLNCSSSPQ